MPDLRGLPTLPPVAFRGLCVTIIDAGALMAIAKAGERLGKTGGNEVLGRFGIGHHSGFYASGEMVNHRWRQHK
jgi:hypothetical protein